MGNRVKKTKPRRPVSSRRTSSPVKPPEMPPENKAALNEGRKMMADLKAEWDRRRDAEYEKWFNDPTIVEQDEKAHSLLDKVAEWERQFAKPKDEKCLDMTEDKIAGKPRPKGARPTKTWIMWDCRDDPGRGDLPGDHERRG